MKNVYETLNRNLPSPTLSVIRVLGPVPLLPLRASKRCSLENQSLSFLSSWLGLAMAVNEVGGHRGR